MTAPTQRNLIIIILLIIAWVLLGKPTPDDIRMAKFRYFGDKVDKDKKRKASPPLGQTG